MTPRRLLLCFAVALPPALLAVLGLSHPMHLTMGAASYWRDLHVVLLPIFPLLGFAPWLIVRGQKTLQSVVVGVLGFGYAAFYSGLDALAGIGAGAVKAAGLGQATGPLFSLATKLGGVGSAALVVAVLIVAVAQFWRVGLRSLPGSILTIVGALLFARDHIYLPFGVLGQLCLAAGWLAHALTLPALTRPALPRPALPRPPLPRPPLPRPPLPRRRTPPNGDLERL